MTSLDGRVLQTIDVGSTLYSVTETPEKYGSMVDDGFASKYYNYCIHDQKSEAVENRMQQCCWGNIVQCCQQYCSALLHLIAG